jgi:hypothetical protein
MLRISRLAFATHIFAGILEVIPSIRHTGATFVKHTDATHDAAAFPGDQFVDFFGTDWFYGVQLPDMCWTEGMLERIAAEMQMLRFELRNECEIRKIRNETFDGSTYISPLLKEYVQNSAINVRSWRAPAEGEEKEENGKLENAKFMMREPPPTKLPSPFYLNAGIISILMDYHLSNRGTLQTGYGTHYDRLFFGPEYYAEDNHHHNQDNHNRVKHNSTVSSLRQDNSTVSTVTDTTEKFNNSKQFNGQVVNRPSTSTVVASKT